MEGALLGALLGSDDGVQYVIHGSPRPSTHVVGEDDGSDEGSDDGSNDGSVVGMLLGSNDGVLLG